MHSESINVDQIDQQTAEGVEILRTSQDRRIQHIRVVDGYTKKMQYEKQVQRS